MSGQPGDEGAQRAPLTVIHVVADPSGDGAVTLENALDAQPAGGRAVVLADPRSLGTGVLDRSEVHALPGGRAEPLAFLRHWIDVERPVALHVHGPVPGAVARIRRPFPVRVVYSVGASFAATKSRRPGGSPPEVVLARRADVLIASSRLEHERLQALGLDTTKVDLPLQVAEDRRVALRRAHRARRPLAGRFDVVAAGAIDRAHGADLFATVARALRATPESRTTFRMRWIGPPVERRLADELSAAGVEVEETTDDRDPVAAVAAADIYLHAAQDLHGAISMLAARVAGLPVLALRSPYLTAERLEGVRLCDDPADVVLALHRLVREWPLPAPLVPPLLAPDERRRLLREAYLGGSAPGPTHTQLGGGAQSVWTSQVVS